MFDLSRGICNGTSTLSTKNDAWVSIAASTALVAISILFRIIDDELPLSGQTSPKSDLPSLLFSRLSRPLSFLSNLRRRSAPHRHVYFGIWPLQRPMEKIQRLDISGHRIDFGRNGRFRQDLVPSALISLVRS